MINETAVRQFEFDVPWKTLCSDNRKYLGRRFVLSHEYRTAKAALAALSQAHARSVGWERVPLGGRVALWVAVFEPNRFRRDLNWSKMCKDAITEGGAVWDDDHQVRDERWFFVDDAPQTAGMFRIQVALLPPIVRPPGAPRRRSQTAPSQTVAVGKQHKQHKQHKRKQAVDDTGRGE